MADAKANIRRTSTTKKSDAVKDKLAAEAGNSVPPTPIDAPTDGYLPAAQQGSSSQPEQPYNDAPPSYEDAIASSLPPVDARRPDYAPPPAGEDEVLRSDEKKGFRSRRDS